jgi:ASC-1-like (ASCH) protein
MELTRQVLQRIAQESRMKKRYKRVPRGSPARSGVQRMQLIKQHGCWPDGVQLGCGHPSPWLQPEYADQIECMEKTKEGRPREGWAAKVQPNDWINFGVSKSGGRRLVCRVTSVHEYASFKEMLDSCGVEACLPGLQGDVSDGVAVYHAFASRRGESYAALAKRVGVVAVGVVPVAEL